MAQRPMLGRQIVIPGMAYAPTNEQGVVALFGRLAPRLGFCIHSVQVKCPDCWAVRRGKECRIEFEFYASDFERHGHAPGDVDVIVCWENDWESRAPKYKHLEILDLKKFVGAPRRVFVVSCDEQKRGHQLGKNLIDWSVTVNTQVDDLVVMYRQNYPNSAIRDLWRVVGPFYDDTEWGREAYMKCIARLATPVTYAGLQRDPKTRDLGVMRKRFRGKTDITDDWPLLYQKIVSLNPRAKAKLRDYVRDIL